MPRHIIYGSLLAGCLLLCACHDNKDDEPENITIDTTSTSAAVTSFNIAEDNRVLKNIDSVFFSINLREGLIFNADSLPVGTRINGLVVEMSTSTISKAEITFNHGPGTADTTINFLDNPGDSIDFSHGPARLKIVAADGLTEANYTVTVNVHQVEPDSLNWFGKPLSQLPTTFEHPQLQRSAQRGTEIACLTVSQGQYCIGLSHNPQSQQWQIATPAFGFTPKVQTFTATPDAYYILSEEGGLYTSQDALAWTSTGQSGWQWIYGAYQSQILGNGLQDGAYVTRSYPTVTQPQAIPSDMPVANTSLPVEVKVTWSSLPQIMIVGGRRADGTLSPDTYGYDGSRWARTSVTTPLPEGIEGATIVPYYYFSTSEANWRTRQFSTIMLIGGRLSNGWLNTKVYYTLNQGIIWAEAPTKLQSPAYLPALYDVQAFVNTVTLYPTAAQRRMQSVRRIAKPITSWQCPYILLMGGIDTDGYTSNSIWHGAINRLTFLPLE